MSPVQIVTLETSGADSSVPHGSSDEDFSSNEGSGPRNSEPLCLRSYRPMQFVSAKRRAMQGHFTLRGGAGCEATSHIPCAARAEFLTIARASEIVFYKRWPVGQ